MLNINQNFDLKAPVFNFDRDYFNSVEELKAYDTSNVPNYFVTNVAGMLYQFIDGKWLPMIGTEYEDETQHYVELGCANAYLTINTQNDSPYNLSLYGELGESILSTNKLRITSNGILYPFIDITKELDNGCKKARLGTVDTKSFGLTLQDVEDKSAKIFINKELADWEEYEGYSPVDMRLVDGNNNIDVNPRIGFTHKIDGAESVNINASDGFTHKTEDGFVSNLSGSGLNVGTTSSADHIEIMNNTINYYNVDGTCSLQSYVSNFESGLILGANDEFKISCPINNTEGATITGVKSIAAFANPSATKVWATDGSTVDLTTKANASDLATKANASDVLLKKNSKGGYYIGDNEDYAGHDAFSICGNTAEGSNSFASGYDTKAYGSYSHTEGQYTEARGESAHAEGDFTYANGIGSHSEGRYTHAKGFSSHAEGHGTYADGFAAHAQGAYNIANKNAIHSVGIGNRTTSKNAEYIYAKNDTNSASLVNDPKNGYKYLIGVGGYDGISTDTSTYKSIQEVIADLTARIEQLETKVRALEAANTPA